MFLGNINLNKNTIIFLIAIAFVLLIIILWVVIRKIVKSVKADKYYEKLAKEELASLGFDEFANEKGKKDTQAAVEEKPAVVAASAPADEAPVEEAPAEGDEATDESIVDEAPVEADTQEEVVDEAPVEEEAPSLTNDMEEPLEEDVDIDETEDEPVDADLVLENQEAMATAVAAEEVEEEASAEEAPAEEAQPADEPATVAPVDEAPVEAKPAEEEKPVEEAKPKARKGRTYNGKYEIYQTADGYAYNLKASNGELLVTSETYKTRDGVIKAINAVKRNLETGEVRIFADKRGQYKFKLVSKNYRILAISSNYSVEKSAIRASESFKKFAIKADLVDVEIEDKDAKTATLIDITGAEPKKDGKFVVEKFNGEFSWALKASNGQILCQAEGYTSKAGCMYSIETFRRNVAEGVFKCVKDKAGNFQYKLYNNSGRICAVGESYQTKQSAESAARSVVSFYEDAVVQEVKEVKEPKEAKAKK